MAVVPQTYGEVFTRRWVVEFILDLSGYTANHPLHERVVVEPSVGSGAFVGPIVERLVSAKPADVAWGSLEPCLHGFDIQPEHVVSSRTLVERILTRAGCDARTTTHLATTWITVGDFLLATTQDLLTSGDAIEADLVVGNPPYIRIEDIEPALLAQYRRVAPTMGGRADIFVGFYEHGLDMLKSDGRLAFICADRWMRNSYGKGLRAKVVNGGFAVDDVIVMHDADAFETEVSAYPAITVLRRGEQRSTVSATATERFDGAASARLLQWRNSSAPVLHENSVRAARMVQWHQTADVWPDGSPETIAWLADLAKNYPTIEDATGRTRIGIGIATGADAVYIPKTLPDVEPEQLVPMVVSADVKSGHFKWTGRKLVSPWTNTGPIDLGSTPKLRRYYEQHRGTLSSRNVAGRTPHWHRTIDRLNLPLLEHDLLVMEDMKAHAHPVRVPAGYYPHHNLTWVSSTVWDLDVLGGLLLSEVVERQVAAYCVRMRGGTLRFQPTVLRKVRIPAPSDISHGVAADLAAAFRSRDRAAATVAALRAYQLSALPD